MNIRLLWEIRSFEIKRRKPSQATNDELLKEIIFKA